LGGSTFRLRPREPRRQLGHANGHASLPGTAADRRLDAKTPPPFAAREGPRSKPLGSPVDQTGGLLMRQPKPWYRTSKAAWYVGGLGTGITPRAGPQNRT